MALKNFIRSSVLANEILNRKFRKLVFKLENPNAGFIFKPGQFVIIKITDKIYRDYSVATLPEKLPIWEIVLDTSPNGPGCKYLSGLRPGDVIETSLPLGAFFLHNRKPEHFLMVASGCGIASIKPMMEELAKDKNNRVTCLWGLRFEEDIFAGDLFEVVLSKPQKGWQGKTGHVTDHLICADAAYLCGSQAMISDVTKKLILLGMAKNKIYFEKYF